jgi:ribonuclease J
MDLNLKKHQNDLLFLPLGGANEIGMNLNLYHLDGKWLMVDCGVGFASDVPGVDMLTPDIAFIKAHKKNLLGIIVTHIHEDHLGAIQYLWRELEVPVYASQLASNFLRAKLQEYKLDKQVPIRLIDSTKDLEIGPFKIEFLGLTHSVPEMKALIVKTPKGNILHTGDWKFDPNPVVGQISDKERIKQLGDAGEILAVICDSTNAINEGHSRSEGDLYHSLKSLIQDRKGLVGVTTFASNIARIHTIASIARDVGRKVVLAGFSLHRIYEIGKKSGYFMEGFEFISDREMKFYDKKELLIICTGCQGEPLAAAKKIATDTHPSIRFTVGDLMIFSSKIIPGNEKKIFSLFDALAKKQIDVMTEKDHFVHVSGHPSQDELREMYALAQPKIAIPVHGEFLHTKAHAELARDCGVAKCIQIENGLAVKLQEKDFQSESVIAGFVKSGYFGVDGKQLLDLKGDVIRERRKLQSAGVVIVSMAVDDELELASKIRIICVGSYDLKTDRDSDHYLQNEIQIFLKQKAKELGFTKTSKGLQFLKKKKKKLQDRSIIADIEKALRTKLLKAFEDLMGKRPVLEITINLVS